MIQRRIPVFALLLSLGALPGWCATRCQPTPIRLTISTTYTFGGTPAPAAVIPDSAQAYSDGSDGVSAYINTGCTNDLVVNLNAATRKVGFSFQNAVATDGSTPSWTPTPFWAAGAYLVVGNLMYNYSPNGYYQFTTTAELQFSPPTTTSTATKDQDVLCFANPLANVAKPCSSNQPYTTSLLIVTHAPADPVTGSVETWTITPDNRNMNMAGSPAYTQVGTLALNGRNGWINAGQFSTAFQLTVTRK